MHHMCYHELGRREQDSANTLPAGSKSTYLLNIGDMSYAGAQ